MAEKARGLYEQVGKMKGVADCAFVILAMRRLHESIGDVPNQAHCEDAFTAGKVTLIASLPGLTGCTQVSLIHICLLRMGGLTLRGSICTPKGETR